MTRRQPVSSKALDGLDFVDRVLAKDRKEREHNERERSPYYSMYGSPVSNQSAAPVPAPRPPHLDGHKPNTESARDRKARKAREAASKNQSKGKKNASSQRGTTRSSQSKG